MSEFPAGTVTFLFTDIEGSTRLLEQLGEEYAKLLVEQRTLLRAVFKRWDGTEVDTQGDSFFYSFTRASDAINAAIEAQREVAEHEWPQGIKLPIRMGLHTGEPLNYDEGYVGMDVHRAARIASAGHGGQILLSETTAPLVLDGLPEGVSTIDLGRHLLKDMNRPEHLRQLVIEGLRSEFPTLNSIEKLPTIETREPRSVGDCPYQGLAAFHEADAPFFHGREAFTEVLYQAVTTRPIVAVIVGSSGSGKSSAVFAGLMPKLHDFGAWGTVVLRPRRKPFESLAAALVPLLEPDLGETGLITEVSKMAEHLKTGEINLIQIVERILDRDPSFERILVVIDQFEELYTLSADVKAQRSFIDLLMGAVEELYQYRESPLVLLITMRADFMGQALTHREFADTFQEASLIMGPMTREELRSAIEKPAEMQGAAIEPGLVER